jgi:vacuolar-type H+-ATPase subunit E/Vma4
MCGPGIEIMEMMMEDNKLSKEQREELEKLQNEIIDEAKKVVEDYVDNPSEISGSTINIHQKQSIFRFR